MACGTGGPGPHDGDRGRRRAPSRPPPAAVSRALTAPTLAGPFDSVRPGSLCHHDRETPGPLPAVPPPLPPAAPRLARRGPGNRLPLRVHPLSGEHPRGVGSPRPRRPGAHRSPVRPARGEPGDAAVRRGLRRVRAAGARQQHRDLPDRRPVAAAAPAPRTLAGGPPGGASRLEEPEELAPPAHPVALPPRAYLPGLHVGGIGVEAARPT